MVWAEISDSEGEDLCSTRHIALWDENVLRESEGPHSEGHASVQTRTQAGFFPAAAAGQMETRATKPDYETVFTNAKAGMDDVDKDYVKRVVYEMSKDSNFFKNEQRKNEENARRNQELKQKLEALSPSELDVAQKWADKYMAEKERTRDLSRTFVHVDMDMVQLFAILLHFPVLLAIVSYSSRSLCGSSSLQWSRCTVRSCARCLSLSVGRSQGLLFLPSHTCLLALSKP